MAALTLAHRGLRAKLPELPRTKARTKEIVRLEEIRKTTRSNLDTSKSRSKAIYDRKSNQVKFAVNDLVYVQKEPRLHKFDPQYRGPFKIKEITEQK